MDRHAGAIIFGGPMSANDPSDYIRREIDWINVPLKEGKPFLGVCLGAQMLARCLGARVYSHDDREAELGYYPVEPTAEGRAVCDAPFPGHVYEWHREGFYLPDGATLLARGETFPAQAMRYGDNAYGLQFHPEVTYAIICRWLTRAWHVMDVTGKRPPHEHREGWYQHDPATERWIRAFLRVWVGARNVTPR
jgi:GMP synthase (glutamine-hydrolysing)